MEITIGSRVYVPEMEGFGSVNRIEKDNAGETYYYCVLESPPSWFNLSSMYKTYHVIPASKGTTTRRCSRCGNIIPASIAFMGSNGKHICPSCYTVQRYSTKNNARFHKRKAHGMTYGFEFECIPHSHADAISMCDSKYGLIPTRDASLPNNGVEFKSPIYYSLNGIKNMLKTMVKYANFTHPSCGQHINIGSADLYMRPIRHYADDIFGPLKEYMLTHPNETKAICGRFFNQYASDNLPYVSHHAWIDVSRDDRIEFRLSKMKTPNQYFHLICMWSEMVKTIITNYVNKEWNQHNADITGQKLVKIFRKYSEGKANCQRPERNKD